jgi:hypothetical protein
VHRMAGRAGADDVIELERGASVSLARISHSVD